MIPGDISNQSVKAVGWERGRSWMMMMIAKMSFFLPTMNLFVSQRSLIVNS